MTLQEGHFSRIAHFIALECQTCKQLIYLKPKIYLKLIKAIDHVQCKHLFKVSIKCVWGCVFLDSLKHL